MFKDEAGSSWVMWFKIYELPSTIIRFEINIYWIQKTGFGLETSFGQVENHLTAIKSYPFSWKIVYKLTFAHRPTKSSCVQTKQSILDK